MTGQDFRAPATPSVVIFDLDGTLTDSQPGIIASYRHTLAELGMPAADPPAGDDAIRAGIGPPLAVSLAQLGVPADLLPEAVAVYRRYFSATGIHANSLYPGVTSLLNRLTAAGFTLALATSKLEAFAVRIAAMFGLTSHFATVIGATGDGGRTTKTEIAAHALQLLGRPDPAGVTLVGDRRDDIEAAAALRTRSVAVTWGYGTEEELVAAGATVFARSPAELADLLLGSA